MTTELTNPHDRFFKAVWSRRQVGRDFLRNYLPADVVDWLDLGSLELRWDAFIDERLRAHYSDMLYQLQGQDGSPVRVYILLEHKRAPQRSTPFQLLRYIVRIGESALTPDEDPAHLPVVIPVVMYQGDTSWPHGQRFQDVLRLPPAFAPYTPEFRYVLCDLSALDDDEIKGAVWLRVALLLMKHIADPALAERLPEFLQMTRKLSSRKTGLQYLETLLRYVSSAAKTVTPHDIRRALAMTLPDLEETLMATAAEIWMQEGIEKGRAQGHAEGHAKGREEGLLLGEQRLLMRQLQLRFGTLPALYQERLIAADADTLLRWSERLLSVQQIEDVFGPEK